MQIRFIPISTAQARHFQSGGADAYGGRPERRNSDGGAVPCRHCLQHVAAGDPYLILAYRPFATLQPYAETGPIFLHADSCPRAAETSAAPEIFLRGGPYILRGYDERDWICYDAAEVVPAGELEAAAGRLLAGDRVRYLHMRSSRNNCFQCRIDRA